MSLSAPLVRSSATIAATLALTGVSLTAGATSALAAPGDSGEVKIHKSTTAYNDSRDEKKVCRFNLSASNFATVPAVTWTITPQPPSPTKPPLTGALTLAGGTGHTADLALPNGDYQLTLAFPGGAPKQKPFTVDCPLGAGEPKPAGAVPAGGGGASAVASDEESSFGAGPVLAVGAVAAAGLFLVRRARRRAHGAA
ncbi:hypothetical protein ACFV85_21590 [Streptomyces niveus]|uniref:hypothetical protein n=1 Tax=Streptomyces niveus TaxID=193462 RepID=UPI003648A04B